MTVSLRGRLIQLASRYLLKPRLTAINGPQAARAALDRLARLAPRPRGVGFEAGTVGGVAGEWTRAGKTGGRRGPLILYFHGGAFIAGSARLARPLVAGVVELCGGEAFAADYRRAPEQPFPAALDDAAACYRALAEQGRAAGRIVLGGDSAGGGIALALALRIRDGVLSAPSPAGLFLLSPWVDLTLSGASMAANTAADAVLQRDLLETARRMYVPAENFADPAISPLFGNLIGLPPVLIQAGSREILRDDSRRLAERLQNAGVAHEFEEYDGMHHGWPITPVMFPEARRAIAATAGFVARVTGPPA